MHIITSCFILKHHFYVIYPNRHTGAYSVCLFYCICFDYFEANAIFLILVPPKSPLAFFQLSKCTPEKLKQHRTIYAKHQFEVVGHISVFSFVIARSDYLYPLVKWYYLLYLFKKIFFACFGFRQFIAYQRECKLFILTFILPFFFVFFKELCGIALIFLKYIY